MLEKQLFVLQDGSSKAYLLMLSHHSVMDGFSSRLFVSEVMETYLQLQRGFSPDINPQQLQYADFSLWQRSKLTSGAWAPQVLSQLRRSQQLRRCLMLLLDDSMIASFDKRSG